MTTNFYTNGQLNKRYPLGIRRYAVGKHYEQKLIYEVSSYRSYKRYLMTVSIILIGFSLGCFYDHPWISIYQMICVTLAVCVIFLILKIRQKFVGIEDKFTAQRNQAYERAALDPILCQLNALDGGLPVWISKFGFKHFEYEKQIVSRQLLCGPISETDISLDTIICLDGFDWKDEAANQAAMSMLHKIDNQNFKKSVFDAILSLSDKSSNQLSDKRQAICAVKSVIYSDEIGNVKAFSRADFIWSKVRMRLGRCLSSLSQIDSAITKNTHSSLDAILNKYDRLE